MIFEQWNVAIRKHEEDFMRNKQHFMVIKNTIRYWAADPFIEYVDGKYYIFAELYDRLKLKGVLGYCIVSEDGKVLSKWKSMITSNIHLSFPYIWFKNNKWYIMPESSKENELRVYFAKKFPEEWGIDKTLISDVKYADSIFIEDLIYTYDNYSEPHKAILLKKNTLGKYEIIMKTEDMNYNLRPAGKAFKYRGDIIIPLQNCNGEYGKSILFARVIDNKVESFKYEIIFEFSKDTVNLENYKEEVVGMHTFNFNQELEVIDIKCRKFNIVNFLGLILRKIKRRARRVIND